MKGYGPGEGLIAHLFETRAFFPLLSNSDQAKKDCFATKRRRKNTVEEFATKKDIGPSCIGMGIIVVQVVISEETCQKQ